MDINHDYDSDVELGDYGEEAAIYANTISGKSPFEQLKEKMNNLFNNLLESHRKEMERFQDGVTRFNHLSGHEEDEQYPRLLQESVWIMEDSSKKANGILDSIIDFMKRHNYPEDQIQLYESRRINIKREE